MDGSRRSVHGNAYFTGVGRSKRIVFFDTLLERLQIAEVEAVLAHELGHFRLHHVRWRLLLSLAFGLAGLAVLGFLAQWPDFYRAFGVATPSPHAALLLFMFVLPVFTYFRRRSARGGRASMSSKRTSSPRSLPMRASLPTRSSSCIATMPRH